MGAGEQAAPHLIASNVDVLAREQADDLLQDTLQKFKSALLPGTVHILMHTPMYRHFTHIPYTQQQV